MARARYAAQVKLLVDALPIVAEEDIFALKGGTAINLFYRDMPRLSVDIDLTYLPSDDRPTALANIDSALDRIVARVPQRLNGVSAKRIHGGSGGDTRVELQSDGAQIKIEVSPVTRGTIHEVENRRISAVVEDAFGFAEVAVVSFEDLFAGKLCAALDRQHPRDLFDVALLYENEGITDPLFRAFLVYAACSRRPLHEIVNPNPSDIEHAYQEEFDGMTKEPIELQRLLDVREQLFEDVRNRLRGDAGRFLLSIHDISPDLDLVGLPNAAELPAIRWKLQNLKNLKERNPDKHSQQRDALAAIVSL